MKELPSDRTIVNGRRYRNGESMKQVTYRITSKTYLELTGPSRIHAFQHREELLDSLQTAKCLLGLGVFSWSNYSREAFDMLHKNADAFCSLGCELFIFSLDDEIAIRSIVPEVLVPFREATTEPGFVLYNTNGLQLWHFGVLSLMEALAWVKRYLDVRAVS